MLELLYHSSVLLLKFIVYGLAWRNSHQISLGSYEEYPHKQHEYFGFERAQSKHQWPLHLK